MRRPIRKSEIICETEVARSRSQSSVLKIALFMPSLGGGGAERAMLNLAGGLVDSGFKVDLILARAKGPYLVQVPAGVDLIDLDVRRVLKCFPGICRYLQSSKPSILLATPFRANILAIAARYLTLSGTRVFIREATTLSESIRNQTRRKPWKALLLARIFYPLADGVVAVSKGVAEDLEALLGLKPDKLRIINNPVVNQAMVKMSDEPLTHPWFQKDAPPVILGVGRLSPEKDFKSLIRAFAKVSDHHDCRLMILGEGEQRGMLQETIDDLGLSDRADLPGFVANPFPHMKHAAMLVLSSRQEGLPNVLIQAMALGTPVIATDCPSGPSEILDHGRYGPLVEIGDVNALADKIVMVLAGQYSADKRQDLIERCAIYRIDHIVNDYLDFFFPGANDFGRPVRELSS